MMDKAALTVDALAQIIRTVDGDNSLGAGALAEAILASLPSPGEAEPVAWEKLRLPCDVRVEPATVFRKGVSLGILLGALERRGMSLPSAPPSERKVIEATDAMVEAACPAICTDTSFGGIEWSDVLWIIRNEPDPIKRAIAEQKRDRVYRIARAAINAALRASGGTP